MQYLAFLPYVAIIAGVGLSYTRVLPGMAGWVMCALGSLVGFGIAIALLSTGQAWILAMAAGLPFAIGIPMVIKDLGYPRINDVTTNVENPPVFVAALNAARKSGRDMSFPEKNASIVRKQYPRVQPLVLDASLRQSYERVERLIDRQPNWTITHSDPEEGVLESEVRTSVFQFIDDVVINVSEQDGKARIDMRSKSRDGLVDAGANAKRIQAFLEKLHDQQGAKPKGT